MSRGIGGYMNLIAADDTILMRFFKDFKVLDREQLHIRQFMDINENAMSDKGRYHSLYNEVNESHKREREIVYF